MGRRQEQLALRQRAFDRPWAQTAAADDQAEDFDAMGMLAIFPGYAACNGEQEMGMRQRKQSIDIRAAATAASTVRAAGGENNCPDADSGQVDGFVEGVIGVPAS